MRAESHASAMGRTKAEACQHLNNRVGKRRKRQQLAHKVASVFFSFCLATSMVPVQAFAVDLDGENDASEQTLEQGQAGGAQSGQSSEAGQASGQGAASAGTEAGADATNDVAGNDAGDNATANSDADNGEAANAESDEASDQGKESDDSADAEVTYIEIETTDGDGLQLKASAVRAEGDAAASQQVAQEALADLPETDALADDEVAEAAEELFAEAPASAVPQAVTRSEIEGDNANRATADETDVPAAAANAATPAAKDASNDEPIPSMGDGTVVESITVKWLTQDTVDNGDDALLYVKPASDNDQAVKMQINYALAGEHNYNPGDVVITIPAYMFKDRAGNDYGNILIPFPADPSTRGDFNWKLVGDAESGYSYQLTNTRRMSAATKGFIQIAFTGLTPHDLVDMQVSNPFSARIEVVTYLGNLLALESSEITAQFDTEAQVTQAQKRHYGSGEIVPVSDSRLSDIPASLREQFPNEEYYVIVDWYSWGYRQANTQYTMDVVDAMGDGAGVIATENGAAADIKGYLMNRDPDSRKGDVVFDEDAQTMTRTKAVEDHVGGETAYYHFATAYPFSQFNPDTSYRFYNTTTFRVTEVDPAIGDDPQLVTEQSDTDFVNWSWSDPKWINPQGHYMVFKNGDDDNEPASSSTYETTHKYTYSYSDYLLGSDGYYGIYPSGINDLQDGIDPRLSYVVETVGYVMPWMYDTSNPAGIQPQSDEDLDQVARSAQNYVRPVSMQTIDTGVSLERGGEKLSLGTDYEYVSVEFRDPLVYKATPQNINPDGSWTAITAGDGTFNYTVDNDRANWPQITLEIQRGDSDEWIPWAMADWTSGNLQVTLLNEGATQPDDNHPSVVGVPEDTANWRTSVTLQNDPEISKSDNHAIQAAIKYDVRPVIKLLASSETMKTLVQQAFDPETGSNNPSRAVWNSAQMVAFRPAALDQHLEDDVTIVQIEKDGYDSIRGYTTDIEVYPSKKAEQTLADVDTDNRQITIHYSAQVDERSFINDRGTYLKALEDQRITPETHGIWRDLLPRGVIPKTETVQMRSGDTITSVKAYDNYRGTGRTLLVVEADLTPVPTTYRAGDIDYYQDSITISFDATYGFDEVVDYGDNLHNVISFESGNDHLGTVENRSGEPDDPTWTNENGEHGNVVTGDPVTFRSDDDGVEIGAMTNLNPDRDDAVFVYAGTWTKLDTVKDARMELSKDVQVNRDGWWSSGVYYNNKDENQRNVYTGGVYSYRLRTMSNESTISSNMIIYDALEEYAPGSYGESDSADYTTNSDGTTTPAPSWRGTLESVDVSFLIEEGCAPVVYYSATPNLVMGEDRPADDEHPDGYSTMNPAVADITNTDVWLEASEFLKTHTLADVRAIAVDARKMTDGSDFVLEPLESLVVIVNMRAPSGASASQYIEQDAHAYNNVWLSGTTASVDNPTETSDDVTHKEYTKVGLEEVSFTVTKEWNDDNDRDGIRPESVTFQLTADGEDVVDEQGNKVQLVATPDNPTVTFEHIPYCDADGAVIMYSAYEVEESPGYTASTEFGNMSVKVTNTHEPERTSVPVTKVWLNDDPENRPAYLTLTLYGVLEDGAEPVRIAGATVYPDADGNWSHTFENLLKYRDGGTLIEYSVTETLPSGDSHSASYPTDLSSVSGDAESGFTFTNVRYPYGDLAVTKAVENVTPAEDQTEFTFTFRFTTDGENGEAVPTQGEFAYEILDADGNAVLDDEGNALGGMVGCDGSVSIRAGQTIYVRDLPEYVKYVVSESSNPGFVQSGAVATSGTVVPNAVQQASFTNKYNAAGRVQFGAVKRLENRTLNPYQFRFQVRDVDGNVVRTATSGRDVVTQTRDDGTVEYSTANVSFGAISYTLDDMVDDQGNRVASKDFTYTVEEVQPNPAKPGYTNDTTIYTVVVTVTDNGKGQLETSYKLYDADGNEVEDMQFENEYAAEGSLDLKAWKELQGRAIENGEFRFELLDEQGEHIAYMNNDASGAVTFAAKNADGSVAIEELNFDESDIGKTYYFAVREVTGVDPTVVYDGSVYGYYVEVLDNGDGTLSFNQGNATPLYEEQVCEVCEGSGLDAEKHFDWEDRYGEAAWLQMSVDGGSASIAESYLGGQLTRGVDQVLVGSLLAYGNVTTGTITAADGTQVSYPQTITYNGPRSAYQGQTMRTWWDFAIGHGNSAFGRSYDCEIPSSSIAYYYVTSNDTQMDSRNRVHYHVGYIPFCEACNGSGHTYEFTGWTTEGAELPVFTNTLEPGSLSVTKIVENPEEADPSQEFTFHVRLMGPGVTDETVTSYTLSPASSDKPEGSLAQLAKRQPNAVLLASRAAATTSEDAAPAESATTSDDATSAESAAASESPAPSGVNQLADSIASLVVPQQAHAADGIVASGKVDGTVDWRITDDGELIIGKAGETQTFEYKESREVDNPWNTRVGTDDYGWATHADAVTSVRFEGPVKGNGSMSDMFCELTKATSIDLSNFDTSDVTDMAGMFFNCAGLTTLDLSNFNTSNVTDMGTMFFGCSGLTSLDLTSFDTSKVTDMASMFHHCRSLESVNLSSFRTPQLTDMGKMFTQCESLAAVDLSTFDTSHVVSMDNLFYLCRALADVNVANLNTANVEHLETAFASCDSLESLDLSGWNTGKANMGSMFGGVMGPSLALKTLVLGPEFVFDNPANGPFTASSMIEAIKPYLDQYSEDEIQQMLDYLGLTREDLESGGLKWRCVEKPEYGPYSDGELAANYDGSTMAGTWTLQPVSASGYEVVFVAAEGSTGSMASQAYAEDAEAQLPKCTYYQFGQTFDHWVACDENGTPLDPEVVYSSSIPANTYKAGDTVYLKPAFKPVDTTVKMNNGEFTFTLHGGETATFDNIPAGTAYQVWEETPDGWVLVSQSGVSGTIPANDVAEASITNRYQPGVAQVQLAGVKTLDGQAAEADAFEFSIQGSEGAPLPMNGDSTVTTVKTLAGGFIQFPVITYQKEDLGGETSKTFTYTITEVAGGDASITYDAHSEVVTVTVTENADGTLSAKTEYAQDVSPGKIAFANFTNPGNLRVTKQAETTESNEDDVFTIEITLNNDKGMPVDEGIEWYIVNADGTIEQPSQQPAPAPTPAPEPNEPNQANPTGPVAPAASISVVGVASAALHALGDVANGLSNALANLFVPEVAYAAEGTVHATEDQLSGKYVYAVLDSSGSLVFFRSDNSYTNNSTGTFYDTQNRAYTGRVFAYDEAKQYSYYTRVPWADYANSVTSVDIAEGYAVKPVSTHGWLKDAKNLTSANLERLDTSNVVDMGHMFINCSSLESLDVTGFDTSKVTNMTNMFTDCSKLQTLDVSNFDTSNVTGMGGMFCMCTGLTSLDLRNFDTSKVTSFNQTFGYCRNLTELDVSGFDTSSVEFFCNMFQDCTNLTSLDVSGFDTSKAITMGSMFSGCKNLTYVDVSEFDLSKIDTNPIYSSGLGYMFSGCSSLESLDVSNWDTSTAKSMAGMFRGCESLTSLDVSNFNTSNVKSLDSMFMNCSSLTAIDVTSFDTSKVTNMWHMFEGCSSLKELDCSSFTLESIPASSNSSGAVNMFNYCTSLESLDISGFDNRNANTGALWVGTKNLRRVVLGPNFKFGGVTNTYNPLPDPPAGTTGKWINEDNPTTSYTGDYMGRSRSLGWGGTWVWEIAADTGFVHFDGNAGTVLVSDFRGTATSRDVTLPDDSQARRNGYILTGWSENADGSGATYAPGETVENLVELGKYKTLYAQWTETLLREYTVKHYQQNATLDGYNLVETEGWANGMRADYGSTVTPAVKSYKGYTSPAAQTVTVAEDGSTVVEYYYDRVVYNIAFDGNGATAGSMQNISMVGGNAQALPSNTFQKKGAFFQGWNTEPDGTGTSYTDGATVNDLATVSGETVTLYAQWLENENPELEPSHGTITVQLKAGQTVVLPNLPAGTTYTVREVDIPDGWEQDTAASSGTEGTIEPNQTSEATVANVYKATGELTLVAHKWLNGAPLEEGQFTFSLSQYGRWVEPSYIWYGYKTIQSVVNGPVDTQATIDVEDSDPIANPWYGSGIVEFDPIQFTQDDIGKTFEYAIYENTYGEPGITYDGHWEYVNVTVKDAGHGMLDFDVSYRNSLPSEGNPASQAGYEPSFTNTRSEAHPGSLQITKTVEGPVPANAQFQFVVNLYDADGNPLDGQYQAKRYRGTTLAPDEYVHTDNIADGGEKISEIESGTFSAIGTVPGAKRLLVRVWDSNPRGYLWIWEGAHEEIYTSNWTGDFNPNMVIKQYPNISDDTYLYDEFFVDGDSISVQRLCGYSYPPDTTYPGYNYWTNYGLYIELVDATDIDVTNVSSGSTVTIGAGESLEISGLPEGATYTVTEVAGDEDAVSAVGAEGDISAGDVATAAFVNTYDAHGSVKIEATKTLEGYPLSEGDYAFELAEVDANGNVVEGGHTEVVANADDGSIAFSQIGYDLSDSGKVFHYRVRELMPENATPNYEGEGDARKLVSYTLDGITYDATTYLVDVAVNDDGTGSLACDTTYTKVEADGTSTTVSSATGASPIAFANAYEGQGQIPLSVVKQIAGRTFEADDSWSFAIAAQTDGAPMPVDANGNEVSSVTLSVAEGDANVGKSEVALDLGTLKFALDDLKDSAGNLLPMRDFTYTITESGSVDWVTNDANAKRTVVVRVTDKHNGTLGVSIVADSSDNLTWVNAYEPPSTTATVGFSKNLAGAQGGETFTFRMQSLGMGESGTWPVEAAGAADLAGATPLGDDAVASDDGATTFTLEATASVDAAGAAAGQFPEIKYTAAGDYYYVMGEVDDGQSGIVYDQGRYLVHVAVSANEDGVLSAADPEFHLLYPSSDGAFSDLGACDGASFQNNKSARVLFRGVAASSSADAERVSAYPVVYKTINGSTAGLLPGEFTFELHQGSDPTASGSLIATAANDESGAVAFFNENDLKDWGLVYDEPGTWQYSIVEVAGSDSTVTYDRKVIALTVTVAHQDPADETSALVATLAYTDEAGNALDKPTFNNEREGIDLVVYKRSRYGGEGLENCTYALWMVGPSGDVMLQEATSDADGRIVFTNAPLIPGQKYYFKEVEAPAGHTLDPYRTAYFSLTPDGNSTQIVEDVAADGWHSKYDNADLDEGDGND